MLCILTVTIHVQRVASLLKVVVQEMDQRFFKQTEDLRKQKSTYKSREEKLQTKIRVLETLATGTPEENEVALNQLQKRKIEKMEIEEKKKLEEEDVVRLRKQKESSDSQVSGHNTQVRTRLDEKNL